MNHEDRFFLWSLKTVHVIQCIGSQIVVLIWAQDSKVICPVLVCEHIQTNLLLMDICSNYRVDCQLLNMTAQSNIFNYNNKQNLPNVNTLIDTHICAIYLYDWTLNDLAYCHNKTLFMDQLMSVASNPPCIYKYIYFYLEK